MKFTVIAVVFLLSAMSGMDLLAQCNASAPSSGGCGGGGGGFGTPLKRSPLAPIDEKISNLQDSLANATTDKQKDSLSKQLEAAKAQRAAAIEKMRQPFAKRIEEAKARTEKEVSRQQEELDRLAKLAGVTAEVAATASNANAQ